MVPSLVDKEATAQEVSPKVRYLSWLSLATLFLDLFSFPGHQSTWSHLLLGPHKKWWEVWSYHRLVPLVSAWYSQFLGPLMAMWGPGEKTTTQPEAHKAILDCCYSHLHHHWPPLSRGMVSWTQKDPVFQDGLRASDEGYPCILSTFPKLFLSSLSGLSPSKATGGYHLPQATFEMIINHSS